jgi:hypothetical protein
MLLASNVRTIPYVRKEALFEIKENLKKNFFYEYYQETI